MTIPWRFHWRLRHLFFNIIIYNLQWKITIPWRSHDHDSIHDSMMGFWRWPIFVCTKLVFHSNKIEKTNGHLRIISKRTIRHVSTSYVTHFIWHFVAHGLSQEIGVSHCQPEAWSIGVGAKDKSCGLWNRNCQFNKTLRTTNRGIAIPWRFHDDSSTLRTKNRGITIPSRFHHDSITIPGPLFLQKHCNLQWKITIPSRFHHHDSITIPSRFHDDIFKIFMKKW